MGSQLAAGRGGGDDGVDGHGDGDGHGERKEPSVIIVNIYANIIVNIYDNPSGM